jgi:proline iminopeptidase
MHRETAFVAAALSILVGCATPSASPSARSVLQRPPTGFVEVEGGKVWYAVHGTGTRTPLLVLHGGPGIPHDYLANLDLLGDERPVVFYDQLGCGRSERPEDPALWTRERFAREVGAVRAALGLEEVVLYGHSWGSVLAVDYLTGTGGARPTGVRGAILAGPALSLPRWMADSRRLIATLPPEVGAAILEGERTGQTDTEAFKAATHEFYVRFVCRADPWPVELERAFEGMGMQVYGTMNGPTEFTITGPLKSVDVTGRLAELRLPLLFICGEHDEATPEATRLYASLAPGSEAIVIPGAAHVANFDQPEAYLRALRGWLARKGI